MLRDKIKKSALGRCIEKFFLVQMYQGVVCLVVFFFFVLGIFS